MSCVCDIFEDFLKQNKSLAEQKQQLRVFEKKPRDRILIYEHSLNHFKGVFSDLPFTRNYWSDNCYSIFTVELLRLLHVIIFKKIKVCTFAYLAFSKVEMPAR